ncbi:MAG: hypothetical protein IMW93_03990 [Thermoanaerobacteraceae bacterium]|nr:hypothetical protein [Thermoanaerobacteraceae bacterium]
MTVLWDTSAVVSFLRADDPHHEDAVACMQCLEKKKGRLIFTNFIVAEVYALLLSRASPQMARQWLKKNPVVPERVTTHIL